MLSIEALKEFGANVSEGLRICVNNESFYLKMVRKAAEDPGYDRLVKALENKELKEAFEAAHALKGVYGNLALLPLYRPMTEMTEHLRGGEDIDYSPYMADIGARRNELIRIIEA